MNLEYVPLLRIQRELQGMPRNYERFQQYLRTIASPEGNTLEVPSLVVMNPMRKEHRTALLDDLLALDADAIAARTVAEASVSLADEPGDFKVALVISDDLMGGWTNRYATEFTLRFGPDHLRSRAGQELKLPRWLKDFW